MTTSTTRTTLITFCFLFSLLLFLSSAVTFPDVEKEMNRKFVLESKKINIPGYPYAFNPSIVRWKKGVLMCFRAGKDCEASEGIKKALGYYCQNEEASQDDPSCPCPFEEEYGFDFPEIPFPEEPIFEESDVNRPLLTLKRDPQCDSPNRFGLIWLDEHFNPIGHPQLLDIPNHNVTYRQQDPRLVVIGEKLHVIYSDVVRGVTMPETRRMFFAEIRYDGKKFSTGDVECMSCFEDENDKRWQKNWVPFDYKGSLLLAYSINPHRIMRPYKGTGVCQTIASTAKQIQWQWGELRGGTPALLHGSEYLAFFHSSKDMKTAQSAGKKISHYFMGAYTFSAHPPFAVTKISPAPIVGKNFYNGPTYQTWKPLRCVFPCGYIYDKNYIWIAYGRQDHEVWITKLDKKGLLSSLVPLHSE